MQSLSSFLRNPTSITVVSVVVIAGYYLVSIFFIRADKPENRTGLWRKSGPLDWFTSIVWFMASVLLILSLVFLTYYNELSLAFLVVYYFLFIFLFAFCYGVVAWHFPKQFDGFEKGWEGEFQYVLISVQTQTTLGYTRAKPVTTATEFFSALQALLGLFFTIIFIAKAVNKLPNP